MRHADNQHRWLINVWGGIIGEHVVGPYFFNSHINGEMYLKFLIHDLPTSLQNLPADNQAQDTWLQKVWNPSQFLTNNTYENQLNWRGGPADGL